MAKGWAINTGNLPRGGFPMNSEDRITDRPDMTSAVVRGRKALTQQQQHVKVQICHIDMYINGTIELRAP